MNINVITYAEHINHTVISSKTVIVIDVLRCTSAIIAALANGAEKVVPVIEPSEAIHLAQAIGTADCILGGERKCNKLPGFNVGNSPLEYNETTVSGKTVIISTTNGTNAIVGMRNGACVIIGAMSNRTAAAKAAVASMNDILLVCAGTDGVVSADDYCAAGSVIDAILSFATEVQLSDIALICHNLYRSFKSGSFDLLNTMHCRRLAELGYSADIKYCLTEDSANIAPIYANGRITA